MKDYIAWLDGQSVARGTLSAVEAKAHEIFNSERYQEFMPKRQIVLRVTRGARQLFVKSIILSDGKP